VKSIWCWCVGAEKRVIKFHKLRVFRRGPSVIPRLHQLTNGRSFLHRTIFHRSEHRVKHSGAVKLHEKHILVELQIVCDHLTAPVGGMLEIKQRDFDMDSACARYLAGYSMDCGGFRRNRNMSSERYNIVLFFFNLLGFVVVNHPTQLNDVRPFVGLIRRGISGRETGCLGIKD